MPRKFKRKYSAYAIGKLHSTARRMRARLGPQSRGRARKIRLSKGRLGGTNMHRYCRWVATPVDLSITGTNANYASVYQLADLQNYTELTALYDRYKITRVQMIIKLITNPSSNSATNNTTITQPANWFPKFWYCKDYDDSTTEALSDLKQRARTKSFVLKPDRQYKIMIKPAISLQTYKTATSTGYAPSWNQWIDAGDHTVPYFGLKYHIDTQGIDPTDAYPFQIRIEHRYWVLMKDVR